MMNRLKAVYRSWAIPCAGRDALLPPARRSQWLAKIRVAGVRRRAERLYEQLDMLQHLRQQARRELLSGKSQACDHREAATDSISRAAFLSGVGCGPDPKHHIVSVPSGNSGPIAVWPWRRARARNTVLSRVRVRRSKKLLSIRGLNKVTTTMIWKGLFKGAATMAAVCVPDLSRTSPQLRWTKV